MRLMLNPNWRPRPLKSFLGFMDIKTGVTIALLFAVLNKVAGVYGLIAVFTGGSLAQLSMYIYSVFTLVVLTWGLKAVGEEDPKRVLYFAHMFFLDHLFSTCWTVFFGVVWWVYTPHDGKRIAHSDAQREMMEGAVGQEGLNMTEAERAAAALGIWNKEKGFAAAVLIIGWLIKIYFAVLIYSYAFHLRNSSYRSFRQSFPARAYGPVPAEPPEEDEEDPAEPESFYRPSHLFHTPHSSIASWSDFVSAGTRKKRFSRGMGGMGAGVGVGRVEDDELPDEVLFDEDELVGGMGSSGHSKVGTEETTSVSTNGDEDNVGGQRDLAASWTGGRSRT